MKNLISIITITFVFSASVFAFTGEIEKSFDAPGKFGTGLTWDGKHLWTADYRTDKIYALDTNGKIIKTIESPGYWPTGLAFDGKYLWNADVKGGIPLSENYSGKIYKIDPESGDILKILSSPTPQPRDLAWDGKYLWTVDNSARKLIQFSPEDGTTIRELTAPSSDCRGLAWDGTYLWVSDRIANEIYMVDLELEEVIIVTDAPGEFTRGLAWDGKNIWAADYQEDKIYKLKVRDGENFRRKNPREVILNFYHRTRNYGPGDVLTLDVHLPVPVSRATQEINGDIKYSPEYDDIVEDNWGQKTAHYKRENISTGEVFEVESRTKATLYEVTWFIYPDEVGTYKDIPPDIKRTYLVDHEKYQIHNPIIMKHVNEAVGTEKNIYRAARKIYRYIQERMYYEMVGGWNTAPTVIERGNGSCSEYSFVYIAMCRAAGIPARYVGAVTHRNDDASMDDVFHRWVEIYLPNFGWLPVDPSGGDSDNPRHRALYFGHLNNRYLITTQGGGGSKTMEWTYNSNHFITTEPKTNVVVDNFAEWEPAGK